MEKEVYCASNFTKSSEYESTLDKEIRQSKGVYYTPKVITDYILSKTLLEHNIVENPYPKIIDISCGCGNFILEAYDILVDLFYNNKSDLYNKYGSQFDSEKKVHEHILNNCLYGIDIDNDAIKILLNSLENKCEDSYLKSCNIYCSDSLKKDWDFKFDYIVGNPPYIGHKKLDKEYKKFILKEYKEVYKDKSDLYYCFYKKMIDILKEDGKCSVITPRYFLESPSGKNLRKYMVENINIEEIIDFSGYAVFKNIGVASCIFTFGKSKNTQVNHKVNEIKVHKAIFENDEINQCSIEEILSTKHFKSFNISNNELSDDWILINEDERELYNKIQEKSVYKLEDICISFQGIITGCDKAFVIDKADENLNIVPKNLVKDWIKNKNIDKYIIKTSNQKLIYSNDIENENDYKETIETLIRPYEYKLKNRRECAKNIRKWYELQWGREKALFERTKIMYPYKASENKFAIDYNGVFSSADVYSFCIKDDYAKEFSYEYLVGLLNSSIYDKYYKLTAKKISKNAYDYYPNKVMEVKVFKDYNYEKIESLSKKVINLLKLEKNNNEEIDTIKKEIDILITDSLSM